MSAEACRRQKTAIAFETGNIQGMTERRIAESDNYAIRRIEEGSFDNDIGASPRWVRYSTAPIPETEYIDPAVTGNTTETMRTRDCEGEEDNPAATVNLRGAAGCNIPGETIDGGYDEFNRILRAKAFETEIMCAWDLIVNKGKDHYDAYIRMLQNDLPYRGKEHFEYALERLVIENGFYNTSAVSGYVTSQGSFPAVPTGTLDVSMIKRMEPALATEGWTGPIEVQVSAHAFEEMRLNYKNNTNQNLETTVVSNDTHFLGNDVQVVMFAGIRWVITKTPPRGYLRPKSDGTFEFVRVLPQSPRQGTGDGLVGEVNQDYFQCRTTCEGKTYELYEIGLYIHPTACVREAFAMPSIAGKTWANNMFNFDVNMIDGPFIDNNKDNFKFMFRLLHAFGFRSNWPERMGAIIYRVSPPEIFVNTPKCDSEVAPTLQTINMDPPNPVALDEAASLDRTACDPLTDDEFGDMVPAPTEADPNPTGTTGTIQFRNAGPLSVSVTAGTLTVCVERVSGVNGAASVDIDTADGTATAGDDYTAVTGTTLNWADGEAGVKCIDIPILPGGDPGQTFNVDLSSVVGATLSADVQIDVTLTA